MAIYHNTEVEHHPGFNGIRVVVSIGPEIIQKYFSAEDIEKAEEFERKQIARRDAYNRKLERTRPPINAGYDYTATEVRGLRINVAKKKGRKGQVYYRCAIVLSVNNTHGHKTHRSRIVNRKNLQAMWYEACKELATAKDRSSVPKSWRDKCPAVADFNKLIKSYKREKMLLDIGFDKLPLSKYPSAKANVMKG